MKNKFLRTRVLNRKPLELDITSLLDILVILLVFLLKAYNPSEKNIEVVDNLTLPFSTSKKTGEKAITLQVDKNRQMWINDQQIGVFTKGMEGAKIDILYQALIREKKRFLEENKRNERSINSEISTDNESAGGGKINILLDQDLPYSVLKNIMFTSGESGFDRFKFVVKGHTE